MGSAVAGVTDEDDRARQDALARLPEPLCTALTMRAGGADDAAIAHELQVELEAVETLLTLAEAKLNRLLGED